MIQKVDIGQPTHLYEILDYITVTERCKIDTNENVDYNTIVEITADVAVQTSGSKRLFSTYASGYSWNSPQTWGIETSNKIWFYPLGYSGCFDAGVQSSAFQGQKLRYKATASGYLTVYDTSDNIVITQDVSQYTSSSLTAQNIRLFAFSTVSEYLAYGSKIYSVKIWQGNTLTHDYIPVKRMSDNECGLYDNVDQTFHPNEVSGYSFLGTSKQIPEYIDEQQTGTLYVNDIVKSGVAQTLHVYEILDYITVPSQSCIDTGLKADYNTIVEMKANIPSLQSSGAPRLFSTKDSAWNSSGTWGLSIENRKKIVVFPLGYSGNKRTNYDLQPNISYTFRLEASGMYYLLDDNNDVLYSYDCTQYTTQSTVSDTNIQLFFFRDSHEYLTSGTKIYSCKVWNSTNLIRDYIPVKRLSDNVYGLYDNVNNTFHPNEVSGYDFSGVSKQTPEYIDGTVLSTIHVNKIYKNGTIYWGGDPLDLTQVDYIEPTGDWTNHGVPYPTTLLFSTVGVPLLWNTQTDDINIDCDITLLSDYCSYYSNSALFGQHAMNGTTSIGGIARAIGLVYGTVNQRRLHLQYKYDDSYNEYALNDFVNAGRCNITISNGTCVITKRSDDTVIYTTTTTGTQSNYNLRKFYLFGAEVEQSQVPIVCNKYRLHYFKIYKNNNLIYDFEPVYNNVTNEYGVHDKLHHQFYASESTTYPFTGPQIQ